MILTKELLEERLKVLEVQKQQMIANVNACEGGIVTLRDLLSDLDREEKDSGDRDGGSDVGPPKEYEDAPK